MMKTVKSCILYTKVFHCTFYYFKKANFIEKTLRKKLILSELSAYY